MDKKVVSIVTILAVGTVGVYAMFTDKQQPSASANEESHSDLNREHMLSTNNYITMNSEPIRDKDSAQTSTVLTNTADARKINIDNRDLQSNVQLADYRGNDGNNDIPQQGNTFGTNRFFAGHGQNQNGDNFYLKPTSNSSAYAGNADEVKDFLLREGETFFKFRADDDLNTTEEKTDDLGNNYYTFQQTYKGLPVNGRLMVVRTDNSDQVKLVTGRFQSEVELDITPTLTGRDAVVHAIYLQNPPPASEPIIHNEPELQVYVDENNSNQIIFAYPPL